MAELNLTFSVEELKEQKLYIKTDSIAVFHDFHHTVVFTDVGNFAVKEFPEDVIAQFSNGEK
jgi:hypothetical protein